MKSTNLVPGQATHPAYLVRFPEDAWRGIEEAVKSGKHLTLSMDDGITFNIPEHPSLILDARATGVPAEIFLRNNSLHPIAIASSRLAVPSAPVVGSQAAQKLQSQNEEIQREKKERAERVTNGKKAPSSAFAVIPSMARTQSSPASPSTPMIPLKTRVVQLLALGPTSVTDIVKRVGGAEQDIMRVVNVVGRPVDAPVPTFALSAAQYSKVKIGSWKYTRAEKRTVVRLAQAAFDELGLPADADERADLQQKERDIEESMVIPVIPDVLPNAASDARLDTKPSERPKPNAKQIASAKQIAKFKAESKRSSSLPVQQGNSKHLASPRPDVDPTRNKRKRETEENVRRKASPSFTSSDDEERDGQSHKERGRPRIRPKADPDRLRDRYEELFPAYEQLTAKMVDLHYSASSVVEDDDEKLEWKTAEEVKAMVAKWERWHHELAEIRRWFKE